MYLYIMYMCMYIAVPVAGVAIGEEGGYGGGEWVNGVIWKPVLW